MESFQQPAFCLTLSPEDFDPTQVPTDGEQYLQSVIYERNNCPAVVVKSVKRKNVSRGQKSSEPKFGRSIWDQYAAVRVMTVIQMR